MGIQRISAKLFVADPAAISAAAAEYIPIFHAWIQRGELSGLPLDVADYGHVPDGPGVMLIGHEADRALDLSDGRPGFLYARKRDASGALRERVAQAIGEAVSGARMLEEEPALQGAVRFRTDALRLVIADRLNAPNTEETFARLAGELTDAVGDAFPGAVASLAPAGDARRPFTVDVALSGLAALAA